MSRYSDQTGYLYVAEYSNGLIKFGVAERSPEARLADHDKTLMYSGVDRVKTFISEQTAFPYRVERKAIERFSDFRVFGNEWVKGVDFDAIAEFIGRSLISVDCPERMEWLANKKKASVEIISSLESRLKKNSEMTRATMAISYAAAIEYDAIQKGYSGSLMEASDTSPDMTKLKEHLARYANAHTTEDVAYLMMLISNDEFDEFEDHLIECIGNLNVHEGVMSALDYYQTQNINLVS